MTPFNVAFSARNGSEDYQRFREMRAYLDCPAPALKDKEFWRMEEEEERGLMEQRNVITADTICITLVIIHKCPREL